MKEDDSSEDSEPHMNGSGLLRPGLPEPGGWNDPPSMSALPTPSLSTLPIQKAAKDNTQPLSAASDRLSDFLKKKGLSANDAADVYRLAGIG